jgi:hypothetical protein
LAGIPIVAVGIVLASAGGLIPGIVPDNGLGALLGLTSILIQFIGIGVCIARGVRLKYQLKAVKSYIGPRKSRNAS